MWSENKAGRRCGKSMRVQAMTPFAPFTVVLLLTLLLPWSVTFLVGCDGGNGPAFQRCGNGTLDPAEQCDDGNLYDDDDCLSTCVPARCGDGFVASFGTEFPEQCDGGNLGSFCLDRLPELRPCRENSDCPRQPDGPFLANPCQQPSCVSFGLSGGPLRCSATCVFDLASCGPPPTRTATPVPPSPTPTRTSRIPRTPTP